MAWQDKVKEAIAAQAKDAYEKANKGRKTHKPYIMPEMAEEMTKTLNRDDEHEGKRLLMLYRRGVKSIF